MSQNSQNQSNLIENSQNNVVDNDDGNEVNQEQHGESQDNNHEHENDEVNDQESNNENQNIEDGKYELTAKDSKAINEYHLVYCWLDTLHFSKPKKNLTRDFADGVMFFEVLKQVCPQQIVEQHNVTPTFNKTQRLNNWKQIQKRINSRSILTITNQEIDAIVTFQPYAIEQLLEKLLNLVKSKKNLIKPQEKKIDKNNKKHYMKSIDSK